MSDTAEAIAQARKAVEPDKPKHVLRTLGQSIREYKKASILAPVFVTVEGILEILIPTIMASLIDPECEEPGSRIQTGRFRKTARKTSGTGYGKNRTDRDRRGDPADLCDGLAGCRLPVRKVRGRGRRGLRQEPAQGPVREGAGLQLHQY